MSGTGAIVPMLDLRRQYGLLREELLAAITNVCDAQSFILGPAVSSFEDRFAQMCQVAHGIGCSSGTDALWLALAAAGIGNHSPAGAGSAGPAPGVPAVITSPFTFFASASCILRAGARPLFADIDPRTFHLDPTAVARLLESRNTGNVRAILPVHLYGQCADMSAFSALQAKHPGLMLIEDAAQAAGAAWVGKPAGSLGDAAAFSFYPTKNLSAFGDAGLVTTPHEEFAVRARSLRAHGMTRRYLHDEVGWNARMDGIQGAVLEVKLRYLAGWNAERQQIAARYGVLFRSAGLAAPAGSVSPSEGVVLPWADPRATHVFHQYVVRVQRRDALREHLAEAGIGSEVYYPVPLHLQPALRNLGYRPGAFPEAERAAAEVLALPIYPGLTPAEQQLVVDCIRGFYA